ncbi:hypothetical protein PRNP1_013836 [Phytophthora ramorum]
MRRYAALLVLAAALLVAASNAFSTTPDSAQMKGTLGTIQNAGPSKRSLRESPPDGGGEEDDNAEERGVVRAKTLAYWSNLAEKWEMQTLAKKLRHKAWLKEGKNPQTLAREYGFLGKSLEELKKDPTYLRYEGFDDLWLLARNKRGTILKPEVWMKQMDEQAKKAAPKKN